MKLIMDSNAVLEASGTSSNEYGIIDIDNVVNVTIRGGKIKGERYKHSGGDGESGHGIRIRDAVNIKIHNVTISDNWGDGIYLGNRNKRGNYGCNKINVISCRLLNNRRSAISMVDVDNLIVSSCTIRVTQSGHAPQCGINLEPNMENGRIPDAHVCKNTTIKNTTIESTQSGDYNGQYMCFRSQNYNTTSSRVLTFSKCNMYGDWGNWSTSNAKLENCVVTGILYDKWGTIRKNVKTGQYYPL